MYAQKKLNLMDGLFVFALASLFALYAIKYIDLSMRPSEDAAMLMRYSKHLAQGDGIVWNVGDKPVDGATDFLFMILLAALSKGGIPVNTAARLVGLSSHILTFIIIYIAVRMLHQSGQWAAFISAAYLALGPAILYISSCYGTPFFALFACITWCFALSLMKESNSKTISLMFALSGLIMGLIRPEGVLLAIFMLLGVLYMKGLGESRMIVLYFIGIFFIIGGIYFIWRWNYFGYPLPNPFYKKGGGYLHVSSLVVSIWHASVFCLPFAWAFILGFRSSTTARQTICSLIPIIGFVAIWILLSNEMNHFMRFQYAILPIVLLSWPSLIKGIREDLKLPALNDLERWGRITLISLIVIISFGILIYWMVIFEVSKIGKVRRFRSGRYGVALILNEHQHKNYTLATTEAGVLPLYSNWRSIDAWGLNDQWIAHHGRITEEYLDLYKPQVITFHAFFSPLIQPQGEGEWFSMVMTLKNYAEKNGYILAAAFGETPYETLYYYVRSDFPDSEDITRRIRRMDYYWFKTGSKCINYAMLKSSENQ